MSFRDWERGEPDPRERLAASSWEDAGGRTVEPYSRTPDSYRTRSRRRAAERGQQQPTDDYLPRWATESPGRQATERDGRRGVTGDGRRGVAGGGRHRHDGLAGDETFPRDETSPGDGTRSRDGTPPRADVGWRATETTHTWRRVTETTRWHEDPTGGTSQAGPASGAAGSAPTSGMGGSPYTGRRWSVERSVTDEGYVGSRRAVERTDPASTEAGRRRVVWSGEAESPGDDQRPARLPSRRPSPRRGNPDPDGSRYGSDTDSAWYDDPEPPRYDDPDGGPSRYRSRSPAPSRYGDTDGSRYGYPDADASRYRSLDAGPSRYPGRAPEPSGWGSDGGRRRKDSAEPALPPTAVDPWDASGLHVWDGADRSTGNGRWDGFTDTGQWDRFTDTGRWDDTGWVGTGREDDTGLGRRDGGAGAEGWPGPRPDGFWSGTRLAGDDPRWMATPTSAPRSPAVTGWPEPYPGADETSGGRRSRPDPTTGRRRAEPGPVPVGRSSGTGSPTVAGSPAAATRTDRGSAARTAPAGRRARRIEDDLLDPDQGGAVRSLVYTAVCYVLPALALFGWLLTLSGQAPAGCVTDLSGGGCDSPRAHAIGSFVAGGPRFGLALATSLVVALLLRRVGATWRAASVALASAVVGGGLSTVLISVVTGEPIG
ncbi:hypothetical protein O7606_19235 [Micromonospora sp. WMMD882]|uniref:hypothetical protein n=1 Tax=Micromonospora sp. WMMD882 TaxID=3015151 RepID=UPI00248D3255|nr:hypothetical protein [Micromonospora sp. WMMD882]WBB78348.1 hypothetical protein O7606_19235 [Micromonospora sp. WMMD882]